MEKNDKIFNIESFGLLQQDDSIERVKETVERVIEKLGEDTDFNYRKFQWIAARLSWRVRIINFEYVDNILIALRKGMRKYFDQWGIRIQIKYEEGG